MYMTLFIKTLQLIPSNSKICDSQKCGTHYSLYVLYIIVKVRCREKKPIFY